jgi:phosphopantetheinyl transferase
MNAGFGARLAPVFFVAFFVAFLAVAFFVAFLAVAFFAVAFFAAFFGAAFFAVFFAGDFFAAVFFAAVFRAGAFFAADFFAGDFFAAVFFAGDLRAAFFGAAFFAAGFLAAAFLPDFFVGAIDGLRQRVLVAALFIHPTGRATKMNRSPSQRNNKVCESASEAGTVNAVHATRGSRTGSRVGPDGNSSGASAEQMGYVLERGEVHAWVLRLQGEMPAAHPALACLSAAEQRRADAMSDDAARHRFCLARAALRAVLAACTGVPAHALPLSATPLGKPILPGAGVEFSLSHTRTAAVIAVAHAAVGVDAERPGRRMDPLRVARRILHPDTAELLGQLPATELPVAFIDAWTQREAHAKAVGGGLFHTADTLPFAPGMPVDGTFHPVTDRTDGSDWSIARFLPDTATRAAVVVKGRALLLRVLDAGPLLEQRGIT